MAVGGCKGSGAPGAPLHRCPPLLLLAADGGQAATLRHTHRAMMRSISPAAGGQSRIGTLPKNRQQGQQRDQEGQSEDSQH